MSSFLKIIENAKRVDLNTKDENGKSYADKLHEDMNSMRKTDEQLSQMHSQGFHATISKARSVEQRLMDSESDDEVYDEPDELVDTDVDAETQAMLGDDVDDGDISDSDDGEFLDFSEDDEDNSENAEIEESFEVEDDEIDESDYFDEPDESEDIVESTDDTESDDEVDEVDTSFTEPDDDDYDDDVVVEKEKDVEIESDESDSVDMDETTDDEVSDAVSDISVETESQELLVEDAEDVPDPEPEDISEGDVKDTDGITVDQSIKPVSSVNSVSVNKETIISKKEMVDVMNKLSSESIDVINMLCDMHTFLGRKNAVNTIELDCGVEIPRSCYKLCLDVYHMMNDGDLGEAWFESEKTNPLSVWGTQLLLFPSDEHVDFMMEHGFDESGHESEEKE